MQVPHEININLESLAGDIATYSTTSDIVEFIRQIDNAASDQELTEAIVFGILEQSNECSEGFKKKVKRLLKSIDTQGSW